MYIKCMSWYITGTPVNSKSITPRFVVRGCNYNHSDTPDRHVGGDFRVKGAAVVRGFGSLVKVFRVVRGK